MNKWLTHIAYGFVLLTSNFAISQNDSLKTDDIYIIKSFKPEVKEGSKKISTLPTMLKTNVERLEVTYPFIEKDVAVRFDPSEVEAVKMKREKLPRLYRNYLTAGIGSNLNTLLDYSRSNLRSSKKNESFNIAHKGMGTDLKETGYAGFMTNHISYSLNKRYDATAQFSLKTAFNFNKYHYYGYDPVFNPTLNRQNTAQHYFGPSIEFENSTLIRDESLVESGYKYGGGYHFWQDKIGAQQHQFNLNGQYNYEVSTNDVLKTTINVNHNNFKRSDSISFNNTIIALKPVFMTNYQGLDIELGASIFSEIDSSARFAFRPNISAKYGILDNIFTPYISLQGGIERTDFKNLTQENPFLYSPNLVLNNLNQLYNLKLGLSVNLSDQMSTNIYFELGSNRNQHLFINDSTSLISNRFMVIYDNVNFSALNAEFSLLKQKKYELNARASRIEYRPEIDTVAWNLPNFTFAIEARYYISDKLITSAEANFWAKRKTKIFNQSSNSYNVKQLGSIIDLNLSLEYRYSTKISAFLAGRNLAAQRYELFNNFPVQSIHVLGGIKLIF